MAEVKWIKIKVDLFNDEKIQLIETMPDADTIIVIWFKLLALAGIKNDGGIVRMNDKMAYTDDMLATIFRRKLSVVILALEIFRKFDMIDIVDNKILITNWEKHQNVDGLDKIKLQNKDRQQRYRDNQKALLIESKEESKEKNKELDIKNKSKRESVMNTLRNVTGIITYLNDKCNTKYKTSTASTKSKINARLNEGYTLENFYKVIDIKYNEWFKTDMAKFLRPETLFGNKFEGYLNQVEDKKEVPTNRYDDVEMKFEE